MKNIVLVLGIGLILLSCGMKKEGYKITGNIVGAGNGKAILTIAENREVKTTDTVKMKNGQFVFSGQLPEPTFVGIQVCPENGKIVVLGFVAENSSIQIDGNWSEAKKQYGEYYSLNVDVVGSRNNDVYQKIQGVYSELLKSPEFKEYAEVQQKLSELRNSDVEAYYKLENETEELAEAFKKAVLQRQLALIRENRSVESVASCLHFMWNDMSLDELKEIYQGLDVNVQQSQMAAELREELAAREKVKPGMMAPDFSLETPDGSKLALSDLRGKYVVLDFWASWCRPCRASFPEMKNIYAKYKDKGLEILGVTNDSRKKDWIQALEQDQLPWKQVIDEFPIEHKPAMVATMYAIPYLPTLVLIGPDGKIIGQAKDKHQLVEWLEERL